MSANTITSNPQLMEQISTIVQQSLPPAASSLSVVHYETGTPSTISSSDAVTVFMLGVPTIVPTKPTYVMVSFSFTTGTGTDPITVSLSDGFVTLASYSITGLPDQRVTQSYVFQFTATTESASSLSLGLSQTSGAMSASSTDDYWMACVLQQ